MNSSTLATVMGFSHPAASGYVPLVDWSTGAPMILGKPVLECTSAPDIGAANYPIAFGDIGQGYAVGTHRRPTVLRDPYTATPKIRYYALARLGGAVWSPEAVILLKSNNT
jgi:HK97 family phage major capsid protein